tara:strand:+ start:19315 stop:19728 length:414 start_codon:yes stop_codon:yes gene_type:complete
MSNEDFFVCEDISSTLNKYFASNKYDSIIDKMYNTMNGDNLEDASGLFVDMNNFNFFLQSKNSSFINNIQNKDDINTSISQNKSVEKKSEDYKQIFEQKYLLIILTIIMYLLVAIFIFYYFKKSIFTNNPNLQKPAK